MHSPAAFGGGGGGGVTFPTMELLARLREILNDEDFKVEKKDLTEPVADRTQAILFKMLVGKIGQDRKNH